MKLILDGKKLQIWVKRNKFQMKSSGCEVVRIDELTNFLDGDVVLDPADLKVPFAKAQDKPDYEAIIKEIETYMCNEEYRLRTEGYAMVSGASRGENFLRKLKAKHTPVSRETDVREKPEGKE